MRSARTHFLRTVVSRWGAIVSSLYLLAYPSSHAFPKKRTITITSIPSGANISWVDPKTKQTRSATTPFNNEFSIEKDAPIAVTVTAPGFFEQSFTFDYDSAPNDRRAEWKTNAILARKEYPFALDVRPTPASASVEIDDGNKLKAASAQVRFRRTAPDQSDWNTIRVTLSAPNYKEITRLLNFSDMPPAIKTQLDTGFSADQPWVLPMGLREIRRDVILRVDTDQPEVDVLVDNVVIGRTSSLSAGKSSFTTNLVYLRDDISDFSGKSIRIRKQDFEIRSGGAAPDESFQTNVVPNSETVSLSVLGFTAAPFVRTPVRVWSLSGPTATVISTQQFSAVNQSGSKASEFTKMREGTLFIAGRIGPVPDQGETIVYTQSGFDPNPGSTETAVSRGEIMLQNGPLRQPASIHRPRRGEGIPLDPTVAGDTLYFSGIYNGCRCIMSKPFNSTAAAGAVSQIYDRSFADSEPALAPSSKDKPIIAFTRRPAIEVADQQPMVMLFNSALGRLTQLEEGQSPAWDPTGNYVAFIKKGTLYVMSATTGSPPTPISDEGEEASAPVWSPNGRFIIYASLRTIDGKRSQSDIVMMRAEGGGKVTLVANGSYNIFPAVSGDGKRLFFFTNRGARRSGDPVLTIDTIDLVGEAL